MGWQPIDTAPKPDFDDTTTSRYLLGYVPDECSTPIDRQSLISVIWWEPLISGGCWYSEMDIPIKPTHWMPLPQAPTTEQTEKG